MKACLTAVRPAERMTSCHVARIIDLMALGSLVAACGPDRQAIPTANLGEERVVAAQSWDTIFQVGTGDVNDTLFAGPDEVLMWGARIVVSDWILNHVRAFSADGDLLWTAGREGPGPGEFSYIDAMAVAENGNLWVLDSRAVRVSEISPDGEFVRLISLQHLPFPPGDVLSLADRVLFFRNRPDRAFTFADARTFDILGSHAIPWPGELDSSMNLKQIVAAFIPGRTAWVNAFRFGPGFMVWRDGSVHRHHYIESIPFALKVKSHVRAMGADSARFGAVSISAVEDELYVLFGGRPFRSAHAMEPTVWIDVYGITGEYRRSYRLPVDAEAMATDGKTFYVLQTELYPSLLALRPRARHRDRNTAR